MKKFRNEKLLQAVIKEAIIDETLNFVTSRAYKYFLGSTGFTNFCDRIHNGGKLLQQFQLIMEYSRHLSLLLRSVYRSSQFSLCLPVVWTRFSDCVLSLYKPGCSGFQPSINNYIPTNSSINKLYRHMFLTN